MMAVTAEGHRDILGIWAGDGGEGAKYWLSVFTDLSRVGDWKRSSSHRASPRPYSATGTFVMSGPGMTVEQCGVVLTIGQDHPAGLPAQ